jgi:4-hydroxybenzoate polyprenyltransferase
MSKTDTFISFGLLIAGILLHPLYKAFTGEWSWPVTVVGFILIGLGILYQFYALFRNKQYEKLKWQAIRLGVMTGVLLLLFLVWGEK